MKYKGSCHCGAVTFEVEALKHLEANECNCSICSKSRFLHLIVPKSKFLLLTGSSSLSTYTFNTRVAQHRFCSICGVKSFYVPRSNPEGISVNIRCLDVEPEFIQITPFDGQNWEENAHKLSHKSKGY